MKRLLFLLLATPALADWANERDNFAAVYSSESAPAREAAVRALKEFDHPEGMALLLECYRAEKDTDVRHALADAMNAIRNVKARDVFRETILKHPDPAARARFCALFAHARMLDRFEMIRLLLRDEAAIVRARALRNLGPEDSALTPDASKRLADVEADVRMAACGALGAIKSGDGVPALIAALETEKSSEVKWAVGDALTKISGKELQQDVAAWREWWAEEKTRFLPPVERALAKGAEYLRPQLAAILAAEAGRVLPGLRSQDVELMVYACFHAGVPADDPVMVQGLKHLLEMPLDSTYRVSIAAMALADLDAKKHRERLAEIAQWLCDTQCVNGQWSYGVSARADTKSKRPEKKTATGSAQPEEPKPIRIAWKELPRTASGDNSNTQYALLGLRACLLGTLDVPNKPWERSLSWFKRCQANDGGWNYGHAGFGGTGSMTAGGLSSVVICMRALGLDDELQQEKMKAVKELKLGLKWLAENFSVTSNPRQASSFLYYYLYGLERAGMILGVHAFGEHDWYKEGCDFLLKSQAENGSWQHESPIWDTCFAILFLKKATRGYTVSGPGK